MDTTRRRILKVAGAAALGGLGAAVAGRAIAQELSRALAPSRRFAMLVDLQACLRQEGCARCVDACHREHNVPDFGDGSRHDVRWIWREPYERLFSTEQTGYASRPLAGLQVIALCNHCESPPCVRVCPTGATWRRDDGLVMMDDHRCIGCRYCIAACPYDARSFNWRDPREGLDQVAVVAGYPTRTRGVVEKCTFCAERIGRGEPTPACVEACPEAALFFGDLADPASRPRRLLERRHALTRRPSLGTGPHVFYLI